MGASLTSVSSNSAMWLGGNNSLGVISIFEKSEVADVLIS